MKNLEERINNLPEILKKMVISVLENNEKAVEFSKKIPVFKDIIIRDSLTGETFTRFTNRYKDLYLSWGINRGMYNENNTTNYEGSSFSKELFNIYVNTLDLYNSHNTYNLESLSKLSFYYDKVNSTFYVEDNKIEEFLDALNEWYLQAREKCKEDVKTAKRKELLEQLEKLG